MATKKKPTQLDRIEAKIDELIDRAKTTHSLQTSDHDHIVHRIIPKLDALSQPTVDKAAPQPESLQPGDYTNASKEVADALTAMGFKWHDGDRTKYELTEWSIEGVMVNWDMQGRAHLDPATFLSRAAVTAKEIGLVPAGPWVPKVGDWVVVTGTAGVGGIVKGFVGQIDRCEPHTTPTGISGWLLPGLGSWFQEHNLRPATDAEIAAHLAEQEARANAEKLAKLKAMKPGTPIKVKGKKQCTFIATEKEHLVWYAHNENESYYAALCGASDITVIDPQP